jgi:predicted AlkP superfamily pyrophosphatase or phosphodiesterase
MDLFDGSLMRNVLRSWIGGVLSCAVVAVCGVPLLAQAGGMLPEHVIVLSIDGLMPETYVDGDTGFPAPNVRELAAKGCASLGIAPIFPSLTYPNHTTIVTGVSPIRHGIDENHQFDPFGKLNSSWYNYAEMNTLPTLWDLVRQPAASPRPYSGR